MDSSSRILIPKRLCEYAELEKEIILVAQIDKVEIWDKEKYEKWFNEPDFDFEELAEEVMGGMDELE